MLGLYKLKNGENTVLNDTVIPCVGEVKCLPSKGAACTMEYRGMLIQETIT